MNKETLNKLKELAKAATKGPWMTWATTADNGNYAGLDVMTHDGGALIAEETHPCDADAHFIAAANPAAILELIALASQSLVAHTDAGGVEFPADERNDDPAEAAFWRFDARKKGYGRWKGAPQSERDAFKAEYRAALVAPPASDTDKVRAIADFIESGIQYNQDAPDMPPEPASKWDYEAGLLVYELRSMAGQAPVREVPGWQPIETAPRGAKGVSFFMAAWGPEESQSVGKCIRIGDDFYAAGVFYCLGNKEKPYELREVKVQPTHWMPLPAAPVQQEGAKP